MNARRFSVLAPEGTGDVVDCFPAVRFCIGLRPTADCSSSRPTMEVCSANSCGGSGTVPSPAHHGHPPMVPPTDGRTRVERRATAQGQTPDVLPPLWGRPPSGAMVCVTGDDGTVRLRRLGDSYRIGNCCAMAGTAGSAQRPSGGCRMAPQSSSPAATTAPCGSGGWPTRPCFSLCYTYPNR